MSPQKSKKRDYRPHGRKPTPPVDVDESAVLKLDEVAGYLNCTCVTAQRLARQGEIPSFRVGGRWRVLKSELDMWMANGGGVSNRPPVPPQAIDLA
jgi:excisionase family DNA binding protein